MEKKSGKKKYSSPKISKFDLSKKQRFAQLGCKLNSSGINHSLPAGNCTSETCDASSPIS